MPRYARNTVILAKIESTYGTDAVPVNTTDALLVSNLLVNPLSLQSFERDLVRPYLGAQRAIPGPAFVEADFEVELASSGSMVTPTMPAWGALMRACGFSQTGTANVRVEYNPISAGLEGLTIYYFDDGVRKKMLGCRGTAQIRMRVNEIPKIAYKFTGMDGGEAAVANPSPTLTAWQQPLAVTNPNTGDITIGCTYTAATPALTGGTSYDSTGLEIDIGNSVVHTAVLGLEEIDITAREVTGKMAIDLTAAQMVTFTGYVRDVTLQSMGLLHGLSAGGKILVYAPSVQLADVRLTEFSGRRLAEFDLRFLPTNGNDEIKLVAA